MLGPTLDLLGQTFQARGRQGVNQPVSPEAQPGYYRQLEETTSFSSKQTQFQEITHDMCSSEYIQTFLTLMLWTIRVCQLLLGSVIPAL